MQPNLNQEERQQPEVQPSQASLGSHPLESPVQQQKQPVVTLTSEQPATVPVQPLASMEQQGAVDETMSEDVTTGDDEPVYWQAHEYIHHEKSSLWFVIFAIVVVVLTAVAIFVIKSITFAILVPVMAVALITYTYRPPRLLDYTLSRQGLHINDHLYPFADFKSFGVVHDGEEYSVMLIPVKRFRPGISIYFPEESGEAIVDMLGARLPMEELHLDVIDTVIRKLRL